MKALIVAVIAGVFMIPTTGAEANVNRDGTHCVDNYKFWHAPFGASRPEVEKFFQTQGLGVRLDLTDDGKAKTWWTYRWCGKVPKGYSMRAVQTEYRPGEGLVSVTRASITADGSYRIEADR